MRKSPRRAVFNRFCNISCIFMLLFVFINAKAQTNVPLMISYQGQCIQTDGKAMTGTHKITATLYSDRFCKDTVWQGTYNAEVENGIFNIALGSGGYRLPDVSLMGRPLWLGVRVDNNEEMRPLTQFAASPYALN